MSEPDSPHAASLPASLEIGSRATLADLVHALSFKSDPQDFKREPEDIFTGPLLQAGWKRAFGGFVLAQALAATSRTVAWQPHALHALFLRPGDPDVPIRFVVERRRDGRSFAARRCVALQKNVEIFEALISFHQKEEGFDHAEPMPSVLIPEADVSDEKPFFHQAGYARWLAFHAAMIEVRPAISAGLSGAASGTPKRQFWMKTTGPLPDEQVIHNAVLAYMSDMSLLDCALAPHGKSVFEADIQAASLDHSLWFHRAFRADKWLLFVHDCPNSAHGRGLTRGSFYMAEGSLVASVAQEGLIRPRD